MSIKKALERPMSIEIAFLASLLCTMLFWTILDDFNWLSPNFSLAVILGIPFVYAIRYCGRKFLETFDEAA